MGGACGTYGAEGRHTHTVLMREPVGEMPHGRPRRRWEDNIKMDLQEAGWWGGVDRIDLAQDRDKVAGSGGHVNECWDYVKCEEFLL